MSAEYDDKMLEAGLEEVVGGHYPPDLTAAILQAWEARQQAAARAALAAEDVAPPLVTAAATLPVAPPVHSLAEPEPPPRHGEATVRVAPGLRAHGMFATVGFRWPWQSVSWEWRSCWVCMPRVSLADLPVGLWPSPASTASSRSDAGKPVVNRPRSVAKTKPGGQGDSGAPLGTSGRTIHARTIGGSALRRITARRRRIRGGCPATDSQAPPALGRRRRDCLCQ